LDFRNGNCLKQVLQMQRLSRIFRPKDRQARRSPDDPKGAEVIKPSTVEKPGQVHRQQQPSAPSNEALLGEDFRTLGVSLAFLQSLRIKPDAGFEEVRRKIMKMTAKTKGNRSLASHLLQNPKTKHLVGKAEYFVSYAWSGGFGATMNALASHCKEKPSSPFVWMDVAMVDQHAAANTDVDFTVWSHTFRESLKSIGKALLVLTPGEKPIAISRSWCCFEWVSIKQSSIPFEYCVNPKDVEMLIKRMKTGMGVDAFDALFGGINVEKAKAFKPSDQEAILTLMREVGVKEVNDLVMLSVKEWLLEVAHEGQSHLKQGTAEGVRLLNSRAALHAALGEYDEALPLYRQALAEARNVKFGVAIQLNNLARLLVITGDYTNAEPLYREAIVIDETTLGRDHPSVATELNNLAGLLESKGDYAGAEPLFREAVAIWRKAQGDDDPDVASGLNNLASVLASKGDYAAAEPLYREALAIDKKALGGDHPGVATDLNNLGGLLESKGDYAEAETLYREALVINRKALGDDHPSVATGQNNLAQLLESKGDLTGAEVLYREAVAVWRKALGEDHPDVASGLNNLARLLKKQGKDSQAKVLFEETLGIRQRALGNNHPDVAATLGWLASIAKDEGDRESALRLSQEVLRIYENVWGPADPRTDDVRAFVESVQSS
jgi:tetratricopeptide (TPR) repeat protein